MDASRSLDLFAEHGAIQRCPDLDASRHSLVADWLADVRGARTYQSRMMVAYTNADVGWLNALARDQLKAIGYVERADSPQAAGNLPLRD